jgi:cleavage and polyadenylation specificity factor subunit 2
MDADVDEAEREEVPTKVVSEDVKLRVAARRLLLDYEGRSDGRSMRLILVKVAPRHLVLVHGTPAVRCPSLWAEPEILNILCVFCL